MRIIIRNIGKVRKADVKLDGLTVIAGANSSGKSTVGVILAKILGYNFVDADIVIQEKEHRKES